MERRASKVHSGAVIARCGGVFFNEQHGLPFFCSPLPAALRATVGIADQFILRPPDYEIIAAADALMTSATTILALVQILTSSGRGSDIIIPMAIPSFGSNILLCLRFLLYRFFMAG